MSEEQDKESKTEEPSQKKLEDAIEKGQVVNSKEVTSFIMLLFLTMTAIWILPFSIKLITMKLRFFIENAGNIPVDYGMVSFILPSIISKTIIYISPVFLVVIIAALSSSYMQHGEFVFTMETLKPDISRLSIFKGFKRIFSVKSFVEFIKGLFKISLVGIFVYLLVLSDIKQLSQYQELSLGGIISQLMNMIYHILILVTIIMSAIAVVDYSYQKYEHYNNLKMTKQEVKDEYKQTEGNPEVKRKLRQLRHDNSKRRINITIPKATVIITNPEHYAIALEYDVKSMNAPICTAKGLDLIAQKIKELAKTHNIPIVENPPLARSLYKTTQIDQEIPVEHFQAVAKIISYVMKLEEKRKKALKNG